MHYTSLKHRKGRSVGTEFNQSPNFNTYLLVVETGINYNLDREKVEKSLKEISLPGLYHYVGAGFEGLAGISGLFSGEPLIIGAGGIFVLDAANRTYRMYKVYKKTNTLKEYLFGEDEK